MNGHVVYKQVRQPCISQLIAATESHVAKKKTTTISSAGVHPPINLTCALHTPCNDDDPVGAYDVSKAVVVMLSPTI